MPDNDYIDITNFLNALSQPYEPIKYFSPKEIAQEIKKLNDKRSTWYDLITAKMLKETPRKASTKSQVFSYPMEICNNHSHSEA